MFTGYHPGAPELILGCFRDEKGTEFIPIQTPPHSSSLCSLSYWFLSDSLERAKREGKPQRYLPCPPPGEISTEKELGKDGG